MSQPDAAKTRFDSLMKRLEAICSQLPIATEDTTLVVDVGDLELSLRRYQEHLDSLSQLREQPDIDDALGELLIDINVSVEDIQKTCEGLKDPLDRLISAIYDVLPDDPRYADDAT